MEKENIILLMGISHFLILIASAMVPFKLNWKEDLAVLSKLHRQMYWVYGGYVVLSVVFTAKLKKGPIALHTWFRGEDLIFSAYYVYVHRKD